MKDLKSSINLFIRHIHLELPTVSFIVTLGTNCQETRGNQKIRLFFVILRHQQISRQLFANELIVGFIGVQRTNDIISIPPGVRIGEVDGSAARLPVAARSSQCLPQRSPNCGAASNLFDDIRQGRLRADLVILDELFHFFRSGRESNQVEENAANQGPGVGIGNRLQPLRFQSTQEEPVDLGPWPGFIFHRGGVSLRGWLKCPDSSTFFEVDPLLGNNGNAVARIGRTRSRSTSRSRQ